MYRWSTSGFLFNRRNGIALASYSYPERGEVTRFDLGDLTVACPLGCAGPNLKRNCGDALAAPKPCSRLAHVPDSVPGTADLLPDHSIPDIAIQLQP